MLVGSVAPFLAFQKHVLGGLQPLNPGYVGTLYIDINRAIGPFRRPNPITLSRLCLPKKFGYFCVKALKND